MASEESTHPVFRQNGISYLEIPALKLNESSMFYRSVFGWKIGRDSSSPSFEDGTGHVIGHWNTELPVAGKAGIVPYIYVDGVDDTLEKIIHSGGEIVKLPYREGNLRVATFLDPAGNLLGIWQS